MTKFKKVITANHQYNGKAYKKPRSMKPKNMRPGIEFAQTKVRGKGGSKKK